MVRRALAVTASRAAALRNTSPAFISASVRIRSVRAPGVPSGPVSAVGPFSMTERELRLKFTRSKNSRFRQFAFARRAPRNQPTNANAAAVSNSIQ